MAEYNDAFRLVEASEGGYANVKGDLGKITYAGITRKNFPNWAGWATIDRHEMQNGDILPELAPLVKNFYYVNFWQPLRGDAIDSQAVANFVFDWYVNSGKHAIKTLQKCVGMPQDGIVGNQTLDATNGYHEQDLLAKLKKARIDFYNAIVARDASQAKFLTGWINRTERLA